MRLSLDLKQAAAWHIPDNLTSTGALGALRVSVRVLVYSLSCIPTATAWRLAYIHLAAYAGLGNSPVRKGTSLLHTWFP